MAARYAKIEYPDIVAFLRAWDKQISKGSVYLQPGAVDGELAGEPKLDLVVSGFGRVGPLSCQVVHRAPDGGVGLQIPEIPTAARNQVAEFLAALDKIKDYFVESGQLFTAEQVEEKLAEHRGSMGGVEAAVAAATPATVAPEADPDRLSLEEAAQKGVEPPKGRGLVLPDVSGLIPTMKGSLDGRELRNAVMTLAVARTTGLLTLVLPNGARKYGFWSKGGPVGWRTDPVEKEEVLGILLYKAGQITEEQLKKSLVMMEEQGCRQGEAFIEMSLMSFAQLVMLLQKQSEYIFRRVLDLKEGEWFFHELPALPERFFNPALKAANVLYRRLTEEVAKLATSEIYENLRENLDRYVYVRDEMKEVMGAIGWSKNDERFLELIRTRSWRLREVFAVSNLSRRNTARLVWALLDLEFIAYQNEENMERYQQRITELIMSKAYRVAQANKFDVLEIHWICLTDEVERGYKRCKAEYNAAAFHDLTEKHKEALKTINEYLDDAYALLRDEARRRAYREEIVEKDMILNSADLLSRKGEMAIMRQDARDAVFCFAKAVELQPNSRSHRDGLQRASAIR